MLPPIEYGPDDMVRKVQHGGEIHFRGQVYHIPEAFRGYPVAIRPHWMMVYVVCSSAKRKLRRLILLSIMMIHESVTYVSEHL